MSARVAFAFKLSFATFVLVSVHDKQQYSFFLLSFVSHELEVCFIFRRGKPRLRNANQIIVAVTCSHLSNFGTLSGILINIYCLIDNINDGM